MDAIVYEARVRQARAEAIRARTAEVTGQLAVTGERLAATFARMAEQRPFDRDRLRARSEAAHRCAVRAWQWAAD